MNQIASSPEQLKLTCQCCGFTQEFKDAEEAFEKGWDAPPHFTTGYVGCNLCPGSWIIMGITDRHAPMHVKWKIFGRPKGF